jgi:hypothetical protein
MWTDLDNDELLAAARFHMRRHEPLPLDLQTELMVRGLLLPSR